MSMSKAQRRQYKQSLKQAREKAKARAERERKTRQGPTYGDVRRQILGDTDGNG